MWSGACHGKWVWERFVANLNSPCPVFAVELKGLCSRADELTEDVNLTTHVEELATLLKEQDFKAAVLVAHSYGCNVMTGAADVMPERVKALVYVDGPLSIDKDGGEVNHNFGNLPEEIREAVRASARSEGFGGWKVPPFPAEMLAIPADSEDAKLVAEQCTPHPLASLEEEVPLTGAYKGVGRKVYVVTEKFAGFHAVATEAEARGYDVNRLDTHHDCMLSMPSELADIIRKELQSSA